MQSKGEDCRGLNAEACDKTQRSYIDREKCVSNGGTCEGTGMWHNRARAWAGMDEGPTIENKSARAREYKCRSWDRGLYMNSMKRRGYRYMGVSTAGQV